MYLRTYLLFVIIEMLATLASAFLKLNDVGFVLFTIVMVLAGIAAIGIALKWYKHDLDSKAGMTGRLS